MIAMIGVISGSKRLYYAEAYDHTVVFAYVNDERITYQLIILSTRILTPLNKAVCFLNLADASLYQSKS